MLSQSEGYLALVIATCHSNIEILNKIQRVLLSYINILFFEFFDDFFGFVFPYVSISRSFFIPSVSVTAYMNDTSFLTTVLVKYCWVHFTSIQKVTVGISAISTGSDSSQTPI